jgi:hypothetical protein
MPLGFAYDLELTLIFNHRLLLLGANNGLILIDKKDHTLYVEDMTPHMMESVSEGISKLYETK